MERVHLKRRLTAILLADVVGYCRLMSVDEEGTHVQFANYVRDLIRAQSRRALRPADPEHGR
jgi:class 3 adenylate cyclase